MMQGMNYLFKRTFYHKKICIGTLIVMLGMLAAVMIWHEPLGADGDYLMCKMCAHLGSCFFVMLTYIFLNTDINGNRLMRSAPFSRSLRLKAVPLYSTIMGISMTAFVNIVYAVFIVVSGQELTNISDMLMVSLPFLFCYIALGTLALNMLYGSIVMIYLYLPMGALGFVVPENVWAEGFGLSVLTGVLCYIGTAAVSAVLAFVITKLFYEKAEFKAMPQANTPTI